MASLLRSASTLWAIGGVVILLGQALVRLAPRAFDALTSETTTILELTVTAAWCVTNAYLEGYRGFQGRFVPRLLARTRHLELHPTPLRALLAPGFVMGYFDARPRVLGAAWGLTTAIVLAIVLVSRLDQPYRGMIDAGVVVGLAWGTIALLVGVVRWKSGHSVPSADPEMPDERPLVLPGAPFEAPDAHPMAGLELETTSTN